MAGRFTLPHINISALRVSREYTGTGGGGSSEPRIRAEHARKLIVELNTALSAIDENRSADARLGDPQGGYIEVELRGRTEPSAALERKTQGIRPGAVREESTGRTVALYVPDRAREALAEILVDYRDGPLSEKAQRPPHAGAIESVEAFRRARLGTFWTDDPAALPADPQYEMWWAIWSFPENETAVEDICRKLELRVSGRDRRLYFPEAVVVPVYGSRAAIELMTFTTGLIAELRRASDNPSFFTDTVRDAQHPWSDDLASRITWPPSDVPAACILDTGANRVHPLLEPALSDVDQHAVDRAWGVSDDHPFGHGTGMAGLALHGDLTAPLADKSNRVLTHRLETIKLLPPHGFDPSDPRSYGAITQSAISLPEISNADRKRVFCMAVANENVSGAIPSTWSAAIDQAASGTMIGDDKSSPRRLFILATGNIPPEIQVSLLAPQDSYPAEDPSQAWNALTVGAYTDLTAISETGYDRWSSVAGVGELSPHSRTSVSWTQGRSPIKPELVFEGGNRALSPAKTEMLTLPSLSLLTTGKDVGSLPLVSFEATSAAAAQATRMATQLTAALPDYWPETVRALMVHSAEWTPAMKKDFAAHAGLRGRYQLVRRFGYGVPDLDRAEASARDHLALIAQAEIQPYRLKGGRKFNECHYYSLPLPRQVLEQLDNEIVELKLTLSYFIEPNPGFSANVDPQRYQSFGLRFDLRRKGETVSEFQRRVNAAERDDRRGATATPDDGRWMLGPDSISAGSLHCDVWSGPAVDLLGRDQLCIKPVGGWWRNRANANIVNKRSRYSLVVTLKGPSSEVDLYTPITALVTVPQTAIEI